ncbi:hypothetical protein HY632_01125 [Candidatus Uhrbacteria bacterium]|nr:hypothetical protein [Candidatus Uhrbacteria bacterium]
MLRVTNYLRGFLLSASIMPFGAMLALIALQHLGGIDVGRTVFGIPIESSREVGLIAAVFATGAGLGMILGCMVPLIILPIDWPNVKFEGERNPERKRTALLGVALAMVSAASIVNGSAIPAVVGCLVLLLAAALSPARQWTFEDLFESSPAR